MTAPMDARAGMAPVAAPAPIALNRREFVGTALLVGSLAMLPRWAHALAAGVETNAPASPALAPAPAPVVSFHMDQPYVDYTGTAEPYIPPAGARSAAGIADLDDETVFGTLRL